MDRKSKQEEYKSNDYVYLDEYSQEDNLREIDLDNRMNRNTNNLEESEMQVEELDLSMREEGDGLVEIMEEDEDFMIIKNDEEAINEFHQNFNYKPP